MNIGIVGVGLLGGSLAAVLKQEYKQEVEITAFSSERTLEKAKQTGLYNRFHSYDELITQSSHLDFIFLCSPIKIIAQHIETLGKANQFDNQVIITDIGSTKKYIMTSANNAFSHREDVCFIGGHPMTGNEFQGIDAADPLLYENAVYVITPTPESPDILVHKYLALIKQIGAIPLIMDAEKHDQVVTGISHLPQMLATGLVDYISKEDSPALSKTLSAGGFRDMTRIASSQYKMWEDIVDTNQQNIETALDNYIEELQLIKKSISNGGLSAIFDNARTTRAEIPISRKGLLMPYFEIKIRVHDEPGTLLKISTVLAENDINIKDISIQNNREYEGGQFLLSFESENFREQAIELLSSIGYYVRKTD